VKRILDTNVCIDVMRGRKKVISRLSECAPRDCKLSAVTEFELLQGADRAPEDRREEERSKVTRFISCLEVLPFDSECAQIAGRINAELLNRGTPVSITDVFIGASGLRHGWTVVTSNTRDFSRIEGLTLENWR
jgi:tRNA(fMet)-specific endonuclease VapC